jgi:hypothetical protein
MQEIGLYDVVLASVGTDGTDGPQSKKFAGGILNYLEMTACSAKKCSIINPLGATRRRHRRPQYA